MITFTNLNVTENETSLETVSNYAYQAGLSFLVFMVYPSPNTNFTYNPISWAQKPRASMATSFWDIIFGTNPEVTNWIGATSGSSTTPQCLLITSKQPTHMSTTSMCRSEISSKIRESLHLRLRALLVRLRGRLRCSSLRIRSQQLPSGRHRPLSGAAEMHNETWGVIITQTYDNAPYIESPNAMYQDMVTAYDAGAKYVVVFNYPQIGPYGLLTEDHFNAIKNFKNYVPRTRQNKPQMWTALPMFSQQLWLGFS